MITPVVLSTFGIDNASVKEILLSELLEIPDLGITGCFAEVEIAVDPYGTQSGLAIAWDSAASPANGIIVYHDGDDVVIDKCVAGVWTEVQRTATAFSAGALLKVSWDPTGTSIRVYYDDALIGTAQSIADGGIVGNTRHGLFATDDVGTMDNLHILPLDDYEALLDQYTGDTPTYVGSWLLRDDFNDRRVHTIDGEFTLVEGPDGQTTPQIDWDAPDGTWAVNADNQAYNTPVAGVDDVANGSMESGDPPSSWGATNCIASSVADERTGGAGAAAMDLARNGAQQSYASQALTTFSLGDWIILTAWVKNVDANYGSPIIRDIPTTIISPQISDTSWTFAVGTARIPVGARSCRLVVDADSDTDAVRFDDVSVKPLTLSELFAGLQHSTEDVKVRVQVSALTAGTQCGLVARLNSASAPTDFLILYMDDTDIILDECVSGAYTNLLDTAQTYTADDWIELDLKGTAYRVYHITDAGVATLIGSGTCTGDGSEGTLAGMFSTYEENLINKIEIFAKGTKGEYKELKQWQEEYL